MFHLQRLISSFLFYAMLLGVLAANESILSDGQCYRLELGPTGVYEVNGKWLSETLNIPLGSIKINNLKIYGIQGGPLSESSHWAHTERLTEIPTHIVDDGNGVLDIGDQLLFYSVGASYFEYKESLASFEYIKNPYSTSTYVILKISSEVASVVKDTIVAQANNLTSQYLYRSIHHDDKVNLLGASLSHQGSGQEWYGEEFSNNVEVSLSSLLPKRVQSIQNVEVEAVFANRSNKTERVSISSNNQMVEKNISPVNKGDIESIYARKEVFQLDLDNLNPNQDIVLHHNKNDNEAKLWLDYVKLEGEADIDYSGSPLHINNIVALRKGSNGLLLANANNSIIWDVTDPFDIRSIPTYSITASEVSIPINSETYQELVVFDENKTHRQPNSGLLIENQSISDIENVDMLVIAPASLQQVSSRMARHRSDYNNLKIHEVTIEEIYYEYSAGRMDPTAIRNYIRDLYRDHTGLKYVLLFGDASYDYRYLLTEFDNENLIPTFETKESLDPLLAFPSDDYYALLDDGENGQLRGDLDVALGRIIVRNATEANDVVDKIIRYDNAERSAGSWRTRLAFIADDEDNNLHINDADRIAEEVDSKYPLFNQSKIYLDAFVQESTPGGNRYPSATKQLNQTVEQGAMILNFLGHGGPFGWTQERVLKVDDINNWSNADRLPLIITATCSFTGFDDPALTTAGEAALLQPNGGAIALYTTVRSVFASKNFRLTQSVFRQIFEKEEGLYLPIGEVMRRAKNSIPNDNTNGRKFFMIGDPSMRLNIPNYEVVTQTINQQESENENIILDTVGALDLVTLQGIIKNDLGDMAQDFTGELDITVFDKANLVSTLANDGGSFRKEYNSQNNVIYKGKAKVENGLWETSFRVPVDINYTFGQAKISYYALSQDKIEATGYTKQLAVEGSSITGINDDEGPQINLFLNDRSFRSGATVSPNNLLLADINDPSGLNLSTASIGHEMVAFLDDEAIILNDFYTPSTDIDNGGTILYGLNNLSTGPHELTLRVFDVANNAGSATIHFTVSNDVENTIENVIVSPNPFKGRFHLDVISDIRGSVVEMEVQLYNSLGQLLQSESKIATQTENLYSAYVDYNGGVKILIASIRLRDLNTGTETIPTLKKIISLK